jgi:transcriptional repressor NrdR
MKCPYCEGTEDKVIDSRPTYDGKAIRRRRECLTCHRRFTTFEQLEERKIMVAKKDGRREPFNREKILQGLIVACRKRPVPIQDLEVVADEIERDVYSKLEPELSTVEIGRMVMDKLIRIDPVAYVRFASVYQEFKDHHQFGEMVEMLKSSQ